MMTSEDMKYSRDFLERIENWSDEKLAAYRNEVQKKKDTIYPTLRTLKDDFWYNSNREYLAEEWRKCQIELMVIHGLGMPF